MASEAWFSLHCHIIITVCDSFTVSYGYILFVVPNCIFMSGSFTLSDGYNIFMCDNFTVSYGYIPLVLNCTFSCVKVLQFHMVIYH